MKREVTVLRQSLNDKERQLSSIIPSDHYKLQIQHVQTENNELNHELSKIKQELNQFKSHNNYLLRQLDEQRPQHSPTASSVEVIIIMIVILYLSVESTELVLHNLH